jgi:hypothetical protein
MTNWAVEFLTSGGGDGQIADDSELESSGDGVGGGKGDAGVRSTGFVGEEELGRERNWGAGVTAEWRPGRAITCLGS